MKITDKIQPVQGFDYLKMAIAHYNKNSPIDSVAALFFARLAIEGRIDEYCSSYEELSIAKKKLNRKSILYREMNKINDISETIIYTLDGGQWIFTPILKHTLEKMEKYSDFLHYKVRYAESIAPERNVLYEYIGEIIHAHIGHLLRPIIPHMDSNGRECGLSMNLIIRQDEADRYRDPSFVPQQKKRGEFSVTVATKIPSDLLKRRLMALFGKINIESILVA
jgi:hypothetical protein